MPSGLKTIKDKVEQAKQRIREHKAKGKILQAKLRCLQESCPHEHREDWTHYDYGGGSDHYYHCLDCDLLQETPLV